MKRFLFRVLKNPHILNFKKIRSVGAALLHADGRKDIMNITVDLRNFANVNKNPGHLIAFKWLFFGGGGVCGVV